MNFPSMIAPLAHSYNSRGELGMFVNPYTCSCTTCVDHVAADALPPPPSIAEVNAAEALCELSREPVVNFYQPSPLARTITGFHYSPSTDADESIVSPTALRPTGGLGLFSSTHGALSFALPEPTATLTESLTQTISVNLREYMDVLRQRQDQVYDRDARSHDEMAAQDMEFDEIDRKIAEIDDILATLDA
jgi:hypothetical protein